MLKKLKQNKVLLFFVRFAAIYVPWLLVYEFLLKPYTKLDENLVASLISQASYLFKVLGFVIYRSQEADDMQMIGIDGAHPVWIGDPCDGLTLFMLFAIFIIAFPGKLKNKLWFIPTGILGIHALNVLRVMALTYIAYAHPNFLEFNHTYTFTIIVYLIVFGLWMIWVNKYAKPKEHKSI